MEYKVTAVGTLTLEDDSEVELQGVTNWHVDANNIPELKTKFEKKLSDICYKRGAKSFTGTVSVDKREWATVATDKDFSGTFTATKSIVIDFGA